MITTFTKADVKDVLMDGKSGGVKEPYFVIRSENDQNLTVINPGVNGMEFNKTHGFVNKLVGPIIYRCIYGHGVIIIQKNDLDGSAKEVRVLGLRPGVEVEIPAGYAHTIVNTGKNFLITVDNGPKPGINQDLDTLRQRQGLAYYVIDKKGEISFDKNPNYPYHPQIMTY